MMHKYYFSYSGSLGLISVIKIVNIGESVKLQCEKRDLTSGTFVWWVNGQIGFSGSTRLEKSFENLGIVSLSKAASVLQIYSFKPKNEGNYTCALGRTAEMTIFVTSKGELSYVRLMQNKMENNPVSFLC